MTRDDPKLAAIVGAIRVTHDIEQAGAVEVRLYGHRPEVRLRGGKPRATGRTLDPYVTVHQPLAGPLATGDPARLRRLARLLEDYADGLEALLYPPPAGDGTQLDLLTDTQETQDPCPTRTSASA